MNTTARAPTLLPRRLRPVPAVGCAPCRLCPRRLLLLRRLVCLSVVLCLCVCVFVCVCVRVCACECGSLSAFGCTKVYICISDLATQPSCHLIIISRRNAAAYICRNHTRCILAAATSYSCGWVSAPPRAAVRHRLRAVRGRACVRVGAWVRVRVCVRACVCVRVRAQHQLGV